MSAAETARAAFETAAKAEASGKIPVVLSGCVRTTGAVVVGVGTRLSDIVHELAGGICDGSELKAVQVGGAWGGLVPASNLDVRFDSKSLAEVGCGMGDGSIHALNATECVVSFAQKGSAIAHDTVCGQCTFGREGTRQLADVLRDLTLGRGTLADLDLLRRVGDGMRVASLCINGSTAPQLVLTAMEHFRKEFEAHAELKLCPAGVCPIGRGQK